MTMIDTARTPSDPRVTFEQALAMLQDKRDHLLLEIARRRRLT